MKQHAGGWTLRSARARSIRHVVCCGLTFLALVQASGCEDDGSPAAPTLTPLATNRSPSPSGSIPGQALTVGGIAATVDMALYFTDPDGDALAYTATSGDTRVLIASVTGSTVVLNPVSAGGATATVMVTDPGGLTATQPIAVTVDHGDTRDTAAPVSSNDNTQGALEGQGDVDYFGLVISSPETLTIETTGDTDTFGELESDDGLTIASADGGGDGGNFRIRQQVQTGTYYIRVSGATPAETGPYMLEVSETLGPDLVVESPGVTRATVDPEGSFTLSATVSNDGDEGSAATALRYYRSTDATITTFDTQVGTDAVGVLSASGTSAESIGLTAPASAGRYYYGACVDAVSGESSTTNNCSGSVQVTVSEPPAGPDLDPYAIVVTTSPGGTGPGGNVGPSVGVRNDGDEASAATTVRFYQSTDATITTADTEVGTNALGALSPGATASIGATVSAPSTPGTYYYGACVDAVAGESDTTNNCSSSVQVDVTEPPPQTNPDLEVQSPSVSDSSPTSGATFSLSAAVRNDGDGAAAATTLRYYRSTDATITTADTSVGTDAVGGLAAAATSSESIDLTAPSAPGTYYYGACVDAVTGESDTTNNCSSAVSVTVSAPPPPLPAGPDLTVHGIITVTSLDGTPPGGSFQLGASVRNDGDESSAATTLRYYQSTDATITPSDTEVGTDTVGGLSAGATTRIVTYVTAPASAGTYYYGLCVDAVTGESDTTNNCSGSASVVVSESPPQTNPDLAVGSPTASDSSPTTGATFTLSATVRNDGDGAAATTTLRYYRSTDGTITTSDTSVGTDAVGGLSAGATSPESISLTAPSSAGTSYYGACVDTVTGESDTTNNCSSAVSVTVSAPPPPPQTNPDLEVQSPSVNDSSLDTGDSFTLSATVRNDGDGAAAATTLRYYRSTDGTITTSDTSVGTDAVGALSASGTSAESISLTAPASAGRHYYGACVDAVAGESSTTNNCSSSVQVTVSAAPSGPDLHPDGLYVLTGIGGITPPGGRLNIGVWVENEGDEASAATTVRFYQSTDATITTSDTEVATNTLGELSAGASTSGIGSGPVSAPSTPGTYYYGACVDAVAGESDTTNNCSSSVQVDVTEPPPQTNPDLEVQSPSVSDSSPTSGATFSLSAAVRNDGDGAAAATTLRYYRSTDATITTSDTSVGTDAVGGLSAGATSPESIDLTAPSSAGTSYYGACVDAVTGESDTTNNCSSAVSVTVSAPPPPPQTNPDLEVQSPSVNDSSLDTGDSFTLSATVRNNGDGAAATTTLRYYRSTDGTITTSDTSVGTDAVGALSASGTSAESISLTAPASAGRHYYGACVDAVAGESSTTNNCSGSVQVTVSEPPAGPDLDPYAIVVTTSPGGTGPGGNVGPSVGVRNDGDEASAATTVRFYQSTDATITTADTEVGTNALGALSPGATASIGATVSAPSTPGTYYYGACVDAVAGESDTTNNCSSSVQVDVTEPPPQTNPDLEVQSPSVSDSSPTSGATFSLSAAVRNDGDGAAAATTLRYYRSTDATITTADTSVGTDAVGGLAAAATSSESIDLTAPSAPGTYYYGACVDAVTGESDTTNNCSSAVSVTVSAPPPPLPAGPDLTVHGIITVTSLDGTPPGGSFQLGASVRNDGDESSAATTLRYYQSTDATITPSDTEVGTDTVGGLSAGATTRIVTYVTAPASAGTYYYGLCVDAVTGESDTTNNCSGSASVVVSESPPQTNPDLAVGSPTASDSSPTTGATFTLSATVRNDGDGAAATTTLRYYRSTDGTITTSDTSVGTDAVGGLSAGATSPESISLTAPSSAGTSYYGACVDTVTGESDTTNNCSSSVQVTVSAAPSGPDLHPDGLYVLTGIGGITPPGGRLNIGVWVENEGDEASAATTVRFYQSTDATITTSDTEVATNTLGELSAGASTSGIGSGPVSAPSTPGTYYYGACVDAVAGESDTTNNCSGSLPVVVSG